MNKILILVILCLALCSIAGVANPQQTTNGMQPPAGAFVVAGFGPSGISGDQQYLYVMAGGKLLEFQLTDMTLLRSVDLPDPGPPPMITTSSTATDSPNFSPPPPPMPQGLWAGNGSLYVLQGPSVYTYNVPGLTLQNAVALPKPE
ncbi:MAG: hypothetical protein ABSF90_11355 [Syntrophobacteraceae bacterium]|jgi:hypothetical protein